uniref:Uncharacterized protein n=1 Tax=Chromera velia CCMP2878 TaxID=1169474 RepID=A0A0G4G0I8_9ALVE|eukprot:Cvel_19551.t1-p1 / transcript=Cvel_19551.t1 / gene=Cvel_19551 / organism=Chromera_velia_CCMP2878 / gene_product=Ankyrin repeat family A protein 2, putative / transcript_product=Ankyrin repeat family A protein 2, putative / location=Cvel_scaffold1694:27594-29595(-) / protein_length=556 / sequence_SO=supercontig / SO=protein_coding / is_pseudo=false
MIGGGARCSPPHLPPTLRDTKPFHLNQVDSLICACRQRCPTLVRLLCNEGGADQNICGFFEGGKHYPLMFVIGYDRKSPWGLSLGGGLEPPVDVHLFSDGDSAALVGALIESGADPQITRADGHSPLSLACSKGKEQTARLLLESGAAPDGVDLGGGRRVLPFIEAIRCFSISLTSVLLERGADPTAAGVVKRKRLNGKLIEMRVVPLQESALLTNFTVRRQILEKLVNRGARCPLPSPPEREHRESSPPSPPFSQVSPLLAVCRAKDESLVSVLCGKGGADPNLCGKICDSQTASELPLVFVLSDRCLTQGIRRAVQPGDLKLKQWNLVKALKKAGADIDLLSEAMHWTERTFDPDKNWGSGSWLADFISLKKAQGPLLLRILKTLPLKELQKPFVNLSLASHSDTEWQPRGKQSRGDMSPLVAAFSDGSEGSTTWPEGIRVLLERWVAVERRNTAGDLTSPLRAAFRAATHDGSDAGWDLVRELIKRGQISRLKKRKHLRRKCASVHPPISFTDFGLTVTRLAYSCILVVGSFFGVHSSSSKHSVSLPHTFKMC